MLYCIVSTLHHKFFLFFLSPLYAFMLIVDIRNYEVMKLKGKKIVIEKHVFIRPVDVAEYIYDKLNKLGELDEKVRKLLEKIIIDLKDEKFKELDNHFGIEDP